MSIRGILRVAILASIGSLVLAASSDAATITFTFTSNPAEIYPGGFLPTLELQLNARAVLGGWGGGGGLAKAARLQDLLVAKQFADNTFFPNMRISTAPVMGANGQPDPTKGQLILSGLAKNTTGFFQEHISKASKDEVKRLGGTITGEAQDNQRTQGKDPLGVIGFDDPLGFDAFDSDGNYSTFTGGIVTDHGPLLFTLIANELPLGTNVNGDSVVFGSDIIAALFNDLSPAIGGYGARILNYNPGDTSLTFFFDPDQTRLSEVDYGTTAAADGVFGSITAAEDVPGPGSLVLVMTGAAVVIGRRLFVLLAAPGKRAGKRQQRSSVVLTSHGPRWESCPHRRDPHETEQADAGRIDRHARWALHRDQARDGDSVVLDPAPRRDRALDRRGFLVRHLREVADLVTP